jgi:hypothetical protein
MGPRTGTAFCWPLILVFVVWGSPLSALDFGHEVKLMGQLVAYGSAPHLVWMIRDEKGLLYYPAGKLQEDLPKLLPLTYWWTGVLERPVVGFGIPAHKGSFRILHWKARDSESESPVGVDTFPSSGMIKAPDTEGYLGPPERFGGG